MSSGVDSFSIVKTFVTCKGYGLVAEKVPVRSAELSKSVGFSDKVDGLMLPRDLSQRTCHDLITRMVLEYLRVSAFHDVDRMTAGYLSTTFSDRANAQRHKEWLIAGGEYRESEIEIFPVDANGRGLSSAPKAGT
jgi:hypothetical protein